MIDILRQRILFVLASVAPAGLKLESLLVFVREQGFPKLTETELETQLDFLAGLNLCRAERDEFSRGVIHWKVTSPGRQYLEEKGLE